MNFSRGDELFPGWWTEKLNKYLHWQSDWKSKPFWDYQRQPVFGLMCKLV